MLTNYDKLYASNNMRICMYDDGDLWAKGSSFPTCVWLSEWICAYFGKISKYFTLPLTYRWFMGFNLRSEKLPSHYSHFRRTVSSWEVTNIGRVSLKLHNCSGGHVTRPCAKAIKHPPPPREWRCVCCFTSQFCLHSAINFMKNEQLYAYTQI